MQKRKALGRGASSAGPALRRHAAANKPPRTLAIRPRGGPAAAIAPRATAPQAAINVWPVPQPGPPLASAAANLQWPPEISASFAISIRPARMQDMRARLGPWASRVQYFSGTNGESIDVKGWKKKGKCAPGSVLRRGELGCYDSHVRIWKTIVAQKLPMTLIMEDDANIRYTQQHATRLRQVFDELKRLGKPWHMLYIGGRGWKSGNLSPSVAVARSCNGLFAYVLTLEGAQLLLAKAKPFHKPVDVLVANLHDSGYIKAVAMDPPLCYVVPVHSDTVHIR